VRGVAVVVRLLGDQHDGAIRVGQQRRGRLLTDPGDLLDRLAGMGTKPWMALLTALAAPR
jgi:hypothetical protein